ncbi:FSH1-domain-containing protein [Viridothelium virens]|uniref:FSH1-domain-containing protein n=1 Tax=Viridothelium virens TaxID=1048519 RepID=A0A6A6HBV1_VIRVR|nr:FSH1-domain-containing protein [Viridothelium virens]
MSSSTTTTPSPSPRKLKILMLHGYTQSGPIFHGKTRALEKTLHKSFPASPHPSALPAYPGGLALHYPTAPIKLDKPDIPGADPDANANADADAAAVEEAYAWWVRKGDAEPFYYEGMERGFARIAEVLRTEGPFDGVVGFSQGGAAAGMVASLLEEGRAEAFERARGKGGMLFPEGFGRGGEVGAGVGEEGGGVHPPLKFAVSYSGFGASTNPLYQAFYEPKIKTPMLHFLGSLDTVVEEARSLRLVDACEVKEGRVVYHPGGHFLPSSQKQYVNALIAFIREVIESKEGPAKTNEKAEDMDVPF